MAIDQGAAEATASDVATSRLTVEVPRTEPTTPTLSFLWMLALLVRQRRFVGGSVAAGMAIGVLVALLRPATFSTTFSFAPQAAQEPSRSGLASLAGQFGLPVGSLPGATQSPQFYADLLATREILAPIAADSFATAEGSFVSMSRVLGAGAGVASPVALAKAIDVLRRKVIRKTVAERTTGVVTVTVRTASAQASFRIAEQILTGITRFNVETRQSQARAERRFIEGRMLDARGSLRQSEDHLLSFLRANMVIRSPQLTIQHDRLQREVIQRQQLVSGLEQQYEDARIREVRDTPVLTMVERPLIAARPDPRGRLISLLAGASVGFLIAFSVILVVDEIQRRRTDPSDAGAALLYGEWKTFRAGGSPSRRR